MGIVVEGVEETVLRLTSSAERAVRAVGATLYAEGLKLQDMARRMAPREFGNLEHAIKISPDDGNVVQTRAASGRFGNIEIIIYVDGSEAVAQRPGHTVGEYALYMHEGDYGLGYASFQKQMSESVEVGPKFMERAADEIGHEVIPAMQTAISNALR